MVSRAPLPPLGCGRRKDERLIQLPNCEKETYNMFAYIRHLIMDDTLEFNSNAGERPEEDEGSSGDEDSGLDWTRLSSSVNRRHPAEG